jgi:hypothetical protein
MVTFTKVGFGMLFRTIFLLSWRPVGRRYANCKTEPSKFPPQPCCCRSTGLAVLDLASAGQSEAQNVWGARCATGSAAIGALS